MPEIVIHVDFEVSDSAWWVDTDYSGEDHNCTCCGGTGNLVGLDGSKWECKKCRGVGKYSLVMYQAVELEVEEVSASHSTSDDEYCWVQYSAERPMIDGPFRTRAAAELRAEELNSEYKEVYDEKDSQF